MASLGRAWSKGYQPMIESSYPDVYFKTLFLLTVQYTRPRKKCIFCMIYGVWCHHPWGMPVMAKRSGRAIISSLSNDKSSCYLTWLRPKTTSTHVYFSVCVNDENANLRVYSESDQGWGWQHGITCICKIYNVRKHYEKKLWVYSKVAPCPKIRGRLLDVN